MGNVEYSSEVEKRRVNKPWELHKTPSIVAAVRYARDNGWQDKKVQVRYSNEDGLYYVEPYEKGCGCRGLLKYKDFYGDSPNPSVKVGYIVPLDEAELKEKE